MTALTVSEAMPLHSLISLCCRQFVSRSCFYVNKCARNQLCPTWKGTVAELSAHAILVQGHQRDSVVRQSTVQKCLIVLCKKDVSLRFFSVNVAAVSHTHAHTQTVVAQHAVMFTASLKTAKQGETIRPVSLIGDVLINLRSYFMIYGKRCF